MNRTKTSNIGLIIFLSAALVALSLYLADLHNVPVVAPWLDFLAAKLYQGFPLLGRLLPYGRMYLASAVIGLAVFLLATIFASPFIGSSTSEGQLENKLKARSKSKHGPSVKVS